MGPASCLDLEVDFRHQRQQQPPHPHSRLVTPYRATTPPETYVVLLGAGDAGIADAFNLRYYTGRSLDDALAASVNGETFLFVITCGHMMNGCRILRW